VVPEGVEGPRNVSTSQRRPVKFNKDIPALCTFSSLYCLLMRDFDVCVPLDRRVRFMYDHKQSVKEVLRHLLFRSGLSGTLGILRHLRGKNIEHLKQKDIADVFSQIYANGAWVEHHNQDSLSGLGSTKISTDELVVQLSAFLGEVGCRRLVDIGSGDFNWMRNVKGDFDYLGIDVVPQVVDMNNNKYANDRCRFVCMDATRSAITIGDVAVCREVLFHLSFQDGLRLLRNIKDAHFKYVLLTNDKSVWFNSDIRSGD
jgi:hypothetical protein